MVIEEAQATNVVNEDIRPPIVVIEDKRVELFVFGFDNKQNLVNYFAKYAPLSEIKVGFISYNFKNTINYIK